MEKLIYETYMRYIKNLDKTDGEYIVLTNFYNEIINELSNTGANAGYKEIGGNTDVIMEAAKQGDLKFRTEIATNHARALFTTLKDFKGFKDWCGEGNKYGADEKLLLEYFIKEFRLCLADYVSQFSL